MLISKNFFKLLIFSFILSSFTSRADGVGVHYSHPNLSPSSGNELKVPTERLVGALREVFQVPKDVIMSRPSPKRGQSPPQYMLDLYKKMSDGRETLPLRANTVRCIMPLKEQWSDPPYRNMLLYNVTQATTDHVLASSLHLPSPSQRRPRLPNKPHPRARATRVMVYLVGSRPSATAQMTPLVISLLAKDTQDVDMMKIVKEAVSSKDSPHIGIKVEELRRGKRWTAISPYKLVKRTPPLLLIYAMDPMIMDLSSLNFTSHKKDSHVYRWDGTKANKAHRRAPRDIGAVTDDDEYKRDPRSLFSRNWAKSQNSNERPFDDLINHDANNEIMDTQLLDSDHSIHSVYQGYHSTIDDKLLSVPKVLDESVAYSLLTNELPPVTHDDKPVEEEEKVNDVRNSKSKKLSKKRKGGRNDSDNDNELIANIPQQRRKKKNRRRKKSRKDSNLIPYPDNMDHMWPGAWSKWGQKDSRKNKRKGSKKRKNRKAPQIWTGLPMHHRPSATLNKDEDFLHINGKDMCKRHSLHVNFNELGWSDFILAPASFEAYYCAGSCPSVPFLNGATNHVFIQSLLRELGMNPELPAPCCVPQELGHLSLLTVMDDTVVLKTYHKMYVKSCSCQ